MIINIKPKRKYVIYDDSHSEYQGEYINFKEALEELRRRFLIPWDQAPNKAPCISWKTCSRDYSICEYDNNSKLLKKTQVLKVSQTETKWLLN